MLVAVTSHGLTNTFNVYAADNCDATSTCNNTELLSPNNQNNNCRTSICDNFANGFLNTQNNNCRGSSCFNFAQDTSNTQNTNCADSGCSNVVAAGSRNTVNLACSRGSGCWLLLAVIRILLIWPVEVHPFALVPLLVVRILKIPPVQGHFAPLIVLVVRILKTLHVSHRRARTLVG